MTILTHLSDVTLQYMHNRIKSPFISLFYFSGISWTINSVLENTTIMARFVALLFLPFVFGCHEKGKK